MYLIKEPRADKPYTGRRISMLPSDPGTAGNSIPHSRPWITEADRAVVERTLRDGIVSRHHHATAFETAVARRVGSVGAIACGSGTAALLLTLKALGVTGKEVILPSYVCKNVLQAIQAAGAYPVLCDTGPGWLTTPETIAPHISPRTAAIIVVHTFGFAADMEAFARLELPIIEDACQAFGTQINGREAGSFGTVGIYSFHATKCLTTGEGGMAVFNDANVLARARELQDGRHSWISSPLSDLQAALGLSQLSRYETFVERRRLIAQRYLDALKDLPVGLPPHSGKDISFRFPLRINGDVADGMHLFEAEGIQTRRGVDALLHHGLCLPPSQFPNAEKLFATTLSLPFYPALSDDECERVVAACRNIFGNIAHTA
jgi:perosamine synthetase